MLSKITETTPLRVGLLIFGSLLIFSLPFLPYPSSSITDLGTFFGRFHPMILHFPIVLILLIVSLEAIGWYKKNGTWPIIQFLLYAAVISCFITVLAGFLLYRSGEYQGGLIRQHLWAGVVLSLTLNAALFFYWKKKSNKIYTQLYQLSLIIAGATTVYTSHLGGSITHGSDFLTEHFPSYTNNSNDLENKRPEDLLVYEDLIKPAFENHCFSCHNSNKSKGGLILTNWADLQKGGKSGKTMLVPNQPKESELFYRITLPRDHEDRMPPKEKTPLNSDEISLLHWWIISGAKSDSKLGLIFPDSIANLLQSYLPTLYRSQALRKRQAAEQAALAKELRKFGEKIGLVIEPDINTDGMFFAVSMKMPATMVDDQTVKKLLIYKDFISKISLVGSDISDDALYDLGRMNNLNAIFLANTNITGEGFAYLKVLPKLEVLNLSHSFLNDAGILHLSHFPTLKSVFVFDTKVDPIVLKALQKHQPNVQFKEEEGAFY